MRIRIKKQEYLYFTLVINIVFGEEGGTIK